MIRYSEGAFPLPALRLHAGHGQLVCLLYPQSAATRSDATVLLAVIISLRAPFLRCLRLYRRQPPLPPAGTPSAA